MDLKIILVIIQAPVVHPKSLHLSTPPKAPYMAHPEV